jgi:hypothetical protein
MENQNTIQKQKKQKTNFPASSIKSVELQYLSSSKERYVVPSYQRTYSWTEKEVNMLFDDILEAYNDSIEPQLGNIVLITPNRHSYHVIDGQQRLTTLFAIARELEKRITKYPVLAKKIKEIYKDVGFYSDDKEVERLSREDDNSVCFVPSSILNLINERLDAIENMDKELFQDRDGFVDYFMSINLLVQTFYATNEGEFKKTFSTILDYFYKMNTRGLPFDEIEKERINKYLIKK